MLTQPDLFKALKRFDLGSNTIKDEGIVALAQAPFVAQLESLDLEDTGITVTGINTLLQPNTFTALKVLLLGYNANIAETEIDALSDTLFPNQLKLLDLRGIAITEAKKQKLLESNIAKNIKF